MWLFYMKIKSTSKFSSLVTLATFQCSVASCGRCIGQLREGKMSIITGQLGSAGLEGGTPGPVQLRALRAHLPFPHSASAVDCKSAFICRSSGDLSTPLSRLPATPQTFHTPACYLLAHSRAARHLAPTTFPAQEAPHWQAGGHRWGPRLSTLALLAQLDWVGPALGSWYLCNRSIKKK